MEQIYFWAIIGSLMVGALFGLIPLLVGINKQSIGAGFAGFVFCVLGGFRFGILAALPISILCTLLIALKSKADRINP